VRNTNFAQILSTYDDGVVGQLFDNQGCTRKQYITPLGCNPHLPFPGAQRNSQHESPLLLYCSESSEESNGSSCPKRRKSDALVLAVVAPRRKLIFILDDRKFEAMTPTLSDPPSTPEKRREPAIQWKPPKNTGRHVPPGGSILIHTIVKPTLTSVSRRFGE
jgi:hypothetical protein